MTRSSTNSDQRKIPSRRAGLAKVLAPEEVRVGDFVTALYETSETPSYLWSCEASLLTANELVRIQLTPTWSGKPLKVKAICLPYVLVKLPTGEKRPLDVRRYQLARLDQSYAEAAWRGLKPKRRKAKRKNSKRRRRR